MLPQGDHPWAYMFSGCLWPPRASGNEDLASTKEALQHDDAEVEFP